MGRKPCCSKEGLNRGAWTAQEDHILSDFINTHGHGRWRNLPKKAGLKRCGKSCRLRWLNYLRPDIKRGNISPDEQDLIIRLHNLLGNRWALIAGRLPGRTDNEIKNYWNTILSKKVQRTTSVFKNQVDATRTSCEKTKVPLHIVPAELPSNPNSAECRPNKEVLLAAPQVPTNPDPVGPAAGPTIFDSSHTSLLTEDPKKDYICNDNINDHLFTDHLELMGFDFDFEFDDDIIGGELDNLANLFNTTTHLLSSSSPDAAACSSDQFLDCCIQGQLWLG